MSNLEEKLLKQLGRRKTKGYTSKELAELTKYNRNYIQATLARLVAEYKVQRTGTASKFTTPVYTLATTLKPVTLP